jgi:hypothetical protein
MVYITKKPLRFINDQNKIGYVPSGTELELIRQNPEGGDVYSAHIFVKGNPDVMRVSSEEGPSPGQTFRSSKEDDIRLLKEVIRASGITKEELIALAQGME